MLQFSVLRQAILALALLAGTLAGVHHQKDRYEPCTVPDALVKVAD